MLFAGLIAAALIAPTAPERMRSAFLYPLTDGVGRMSFGWTSLSWDAASNELYVVDPNGVIDVFDDNGMMVHSFGDPAFGRIAGVATLENGDVLVLASKDGAVSIVRCNFRGEPRSTIAIRGAPADVLKGFSPGAIHVADGKIYLANTSSKKVVVTDLDGTYRVSWNLLDLAGAQGRDRAGALVRGLSVDPDGNLLFTVATMFRGFVVSPDGRVQEFGSKGSKPGGFNVVGGIAGDGEGHIFVADTLRSVVMAFDSTSFEFLGEFGNRGRGRNNLINPLEIAAGNGRVYVTQSVGPVKTFGVLFE